MKNKLIAVIFFAGCAHHGHVNSSGASKRAEDMTIEPLDPIFSNKQGWKKTAITNDVAAVIRKDKRAKGAVLKHCISNGENYLICLEHSGPTGGFVFFLINRKGEILEYRFITNNSRPRDFKIIQE
jgi:hypothetical protein